jgi:hypothetical protein
MSDFVERVARASYEAEVNRWPQYARGFQKWEDVGPETKDRFRFAARAVRTIVLEEAAKLMEERTLRNRKIYALQNGMRDYVRPCEHAAAIRKLGEE